MVNASIPIILDIRVDNSGWSMQRVTLWHFNYIPGWHSVIMCSQAKCGTLYSLEQNIQTDVDLGQGPESFKILWKYQLSASRILHMSQIMTVHWPSYNVHWKNSKILVVEHPLIFVMLLMIFEMLSGHRRCHWWFISHSKSFCLKSYSQQTDWEGAIKIFWEKRIR